MIIRKSSDLRYSDVTPKSDYLNRRRFLAAGTAAFAGFSWAEPKLNATAKSPFNTDEKPTPLDAITHYNNYYEFGTGKDEPAENAKNFQDLAVAVTVDGESRNPRCSTSMPIMKIAPLEERIYRHRCVEAWSIVVPWIGFPVERAAQAGRADVESQVRGVRELIYDPKQMPQGPLRRDRSALRRRLAPG